MVTRSKTKEVKDEFWIGKIIKYNNIEEGWKLVIKLEVNTVLRRLILGNNFSFVLFPSFLSSFFPSSVLLSLPSSLLSFEKWLQTVKRGRRETNQNTEVPTENYILRSYKKVGIKIRRLTVITQKFIIRRQTDGTVVVVELY